MSIFSRVSDILTANLNALLDRAEDPEALLAQVIRAMEGSLARARRSAAVAIAAERRLRGERDDNRARADRWKGRAREALAAGREDLARRALARKQEHDALARSLEEQRAGAVQTGASARTALQALEARLPDVTFVSAAKWRAWRRQRPAVADFGPDLAVEVLSRTNTRAEMARKRREYFAAGARLVWEVNPRRRTVTVYTTPTASTRLAEADTLTGGNVLPGFALPLAELFADPLGDD